MPIDGFFGNPIQVQVPFLDLSGNLLVKFARNPNTVRAKLNAYTQLQNVSTVRGNYLYFDPAYIGRVPKNAKWPYNSNRPQHVNDGQTFSVRDFFCERYSFEDSLDLTVEKLASFPVQKVVTESIALNAMINRTRVLNAMINTTSNYPAANVVTAATAGGGFLDTGTTANPVLFKAVNYAKNLLQLATASSFEGGELGMLMNPNTARKLAVSREIREFVMQAETSPAFVMGKEQAFMSGEGLPQYLYNCKVIVENCTVNLNNPGAASDVQTYVFPDNRIIFFLRPGDFEQSEGSPTFAAWTQFVYEDMQVEAFVDQKHRRLHFTVTDNFAPEVTSAVSVVVIDNVFS